MKNRLVCRVGGVEDWGSCSEEEEDSDEEWVDVHHPVMKNRLVCRVGGVED